MSVTFNGMRIVNGPPSANDLSRSPLLSAVTNQFPVRDPESDEVGFNLANGNARLFLEFLALPTDDCLYGQATLAEARRAVIRARATFDRHVDDFTREGSDTKRPGKVRVIEGGVDRDYFRRRLEGFAELVERLAKSGATHVTWG